MNDLERDIRELLEEELRSAPQPHERTVAVRRTRRRQGTVIAGGALATVALVAASLRGLRAIERADDPTFGDQPTVATNINGITISHPEGWYVIDPDEAGMNGPDPTPDLPKLILAVAPFDPGQLFACPGIAQGAAHQFLMTIQEEPRALNGPASSPWPVELEPLDVGAAESGCYPGWEFLRAGWTAAGRTFEGRVGFAPDVRDVDRDALLAAFASMTFGSGGTGTLSFVVAAGTAAGEDWELVATGKPDGLELSLRGESFGTGIGGFDPSSDQIQMASQVLGTGSSAERIVFGTAPSGAVRVGVRVDVDDELLVRVIDVPDRIDTDLNAFVFTLLAEHSAVVYAYDETGKIVASGELVPGADGSIGTPVPDEVVFRGRTNECFWTLTRTSLGQDQELLQLASRDGDPLVQLAVDIGDEAPPLQLASFTCSIDPGGTLVFGLSTDEVADIRWPASPDEPGVPECVPADVPARFCFFLLDRAGDSGEAIALDANGNEIGRATFP
jgi:hypothetical protein